MFEIADLHVSVEDKEIIRGISLTLKPGEIHAIMGPNGAGKSSLAEALLGHPNLKVKGSIKLDSKELSTVPTDERARAGLFLAFQNPDEIEGVKVSNLIRKANAAKDPSKKDLDEMVKAHKELIKTIEKLGMDKSFISRELNVGFSGGEKKRLEVLQMIALKPKVIVLDEIDSGLDVDGIKLISKAIKQLNDGTRSFLLITHYPRILKFVVPTFVHIMVNGRIVRSGDVNLAHEIEERGYAEFLKDDNVKR